MTTSGRRGDGRDCPTGGRYATRAALVALAVISMLAGSVGPAHARRSTPAPANAPRITAITPDPATAGEPATIEGGGFGARNAAVRIAGLPATIEHATGSRIRFRLPASTPHGLQPVVVRNHGGLEATAWLQVVFDGTVIAVLDAAAARTEAIGPAGGDIEVPGPNGPIRLSIPAGALPDEVDITVTPITAVGGAPMTHHLGAVHFAPEGLQLFRAATLTVPVPPTDLPGHVLAYAADGTGTGFHLTPHATATDAIEVPVWHFSIGGAAAADPSELDGLIAYEPTAAEALALHRLALAGQAFDVTGDIDAYQAAAVTILRDWYTSSVRPGLDVAHGSTQEYFELAVGELAHWWAAVETLSVSTELAAELAEGRNLQLRAARNLADRLLSRCTGVGDWEGPLRDVLRLIAVADAVVIDLDHPPDPGDGLDVPASDELPSTCMTPVLESVEHPAVFAAGLPSKNTLRVSAHVAFANGSPRTDIPLLMKLVDNGHPSPLVLAFDTITDGRWEITFDPGSDDSLAGTVSAAVVDGDGVAVDALDTSDPVANPIRERLELHRQRSDGLYTDSPTPAMAPGATTLVRARLAGDGVGGQPLTFSLTGPGSLASTTGVTTSGGETVTTYTAPSSATPQTATIQVTFVDGAVVRTRTIDIDIGATVTVAVSPTSANLSPGGQQQFSATVTGASDTSVTWSATCGTISTDGLYTAPSTPGAACAVTATSVADPSASATVSIQVTNITVTISPTSAELGPGETLQFSATVTGTSNTAVTWTATGGTVDESGLYTAGDAAGTWSVTATSDADGTTFASATVVIGAGTITLSSGLAGLGGFAQAYNADRSVESGGDCDPVTTDYQANYPAAGSGSFSCFGTSDQGDSATASGSVGGSLTSTSVSISGSASISVSTAANHPSGLFSTARAGASAGAMIYFTVTERVGYSASVTGTSSGSCLTHPPRGGAALMSVNDGTPMPATGTLHPGVVYGLVGSAEAGEGNAPAGYSCTATAQFSASVSIGPPS